MKLKRLCHKINLFFIKYLQLIIFPLIAILLKLFFKLRVIGLENLKNILNKPIIFAANHQSWIDPIIIGCSLSHLPLREVFQIAPLRFIAAKEYFNFLKSPAPFPLSLLVALFVRINGSIPVIRGEKGTSLEKKLEEAIEALKNNAKIGIFPEGKVSKSGELQKGKIGVAYLNEITNAPIVPIALINTRECNSLKSFLNLFLRKKEIKIVFGKPIFNLEGNDYEEKVSNLMNEIRELIEVGNQVHEMHYLGNIKIKEASLDEKFWTKYFQVYDILNKSIVYKELLDELVKETDPQNGEVILDAGGGTGNLAILLEKSGARVFVLDFSREALKIYKKKNPNGITILADLREKLPFEDNFFDKIVSNNTLYNIPRNERLKVFLELKRVLKPGGKIIISNIHKNFKPLIIYLETIRKNIKVEGFLKTFMLLLVMLIPTIKMFYYNRIIQKVHKFDSNNLFDYDEQKQLLEKAGFRNISETRFVYAGQGILNTAYK